MNRATALVIGAGYLGRRLVRRLLDAGYRVIATTRSPARSPLETNATCSVLALDLGAPLAPRFEVIGAQCGAVIDLYCLLTPRALGEVALRNDFIQSLQQLPLRRCVLTSSTAVYGDRGGEEVTAETAPRPVTAREQRLFAIEREWSRLNRAHVVRLAGLYGRGRVIGMQALRDAEPFAGSPQDLLNLIQVDDAASLLVSVMTNPGAASIELGSDGNPVARGDYYQFLATHLGVSPPRFAASDGARGGKACVPLTTMARLGWQPVYANYQTGVRAALADTE